MEINGQFKIANKTKMNRGWLQSKENTLRRQSHNHVMTNKSITFKYFHRVKRIFLISALDNGEKGELVPNQKKWEAPIKHQPHYDKKKERPKASKEQDSKEIMMSPNPSRNINYITEQRQQILNVPSKNSY